MKYKLIKKVNEVNNIPVEIFENLYDLDENQLKVIIFALYRCESDNADIAKSLSIAVNSIDEALQFWQEKGLLELSDDTTVKSKNKNKLSPSQLLKISRENKDVAYLANQLQVVFGKDINEKTTARYLTMNVLDFIPADVILLLASHYKEIYPDKTPSYIAGIIENDFEKRGIDTLQRAEEYINLLSLRESRYATVSQIFGIDSQKLTSANKTLIDSWFEKLNYDEKMIRAAYNSAGEKASLKYCGGTLKSWSQKGYTSVSELENSNNETLTPEQIEKAIIDKATTELIKKRQAHFHLYKEKVALINRQVPQLKEYNMQVDQLGIEMAILRMKGQKTKAESNRIKMRELQSEITFILAKAGYTPQDLEEDYYCPICKDTGYVDGKPCACLQKEIDRIKNRR